MLTRLKFEIDNLVAELLDQLPESVWTSSTTTFLDPAIGGGQFVIEVERRLLAQGHSPANIKSRVFGYENNKLKIQSTVNKHKLIGNYTVKSYTEFFDSDESVKFDVVLSNPPYHDNSKDGGQNKIYNQFSKKVLALLADNGHAVMLTPTAVLKVSKRFSLIGVEGLKTVNFKANHYFPDVGVNVCAWIVDKSYQGDVTVVGKTSVSSVPAGNTIYDPFEFDETFIRVYEALKKAAKTPKDRMFKFNPVDTRNGRSKTKSAVFQYPVYKIEKDGAELVQYNKPQPKLYGKKKLVISLTKSFQESSSIVSDLDFDVNHAFVDVADDTEVVNIKSFLFSEYFVNHCNNFKRVDGYGFNNAIKFLPKFDKTVFWTEEAVKAFIESHLDNTV